MHVNGCHGCETMLECPRHRAPSEAERRAAGRMAQESAEVIATQLEHIASRCAWGARFAATVGTPGMVAEAEGAEAGFTFRARELRYDARGGMTEEQARRRFEPGARWLLHCIELVVERPNIFGLPLVHFSGISRPVELGEMTRANGWLFLGLADPGAYR